MPLQVTSKFDPFTFEELAKPVSQATAVHGELENEYQKLLSDSAQMAQYLDPTNPGDALLLKAYQAYAGKLNDAASTLSSKGVNPAMLKDLTKLKSIYASGIAPIETAYKTKLDQVKSQREAKQKDPSMQFTYDAELMPVSFYYANPGVNYNGLSLNTITKNVGDIAKGYAKQIRNNPSEWGLTAGGQQLERYIQYGLTDADIVRALNGEDPVLSSILSNIVNQSDAREYGPEVYEMAVRAAADGLREGFGEMKMEHVAYDPYKIPLSAQRLRNAQLDEMLKRKKLADGLDGTGPKGRIDITSDAGTTTSRVSVQANEAAAKVAKANVDELRKSLKAIDFYDSHQDPGEMAAFLADDMGAGAAGAKVAASDGRVAIRKENLKKNFIDKYKLNIDPSMYNSDRELADAVVIAMDRKLIEYGQAKPMTGKNYQMNLDGDAQGILRKWEGRITQGKGFESAFRLNKKDSTVNSWLKIAGHEGETLQQFVKNYNNNIDNANLNNGITLTSGKIPSVSALLSSIFDGKNTTIFFDTANYQFAINDRDKDLTLLIAPELTPMLAKMFPARMFSVQIDENTVKPVPIDLLTAANFVNQIMTDGEVKTDDFVFQDEWARVVGDEAKDYMSRYFMDLNVTDYRDDAKTRKYGNRLPDPDEYFMADDDDRDGTEEE